MADIDVCQLAREIASRMDPLALLDAADVGALLKCCPRQVTERFSKSIDFPKPVPLAAGGATRNRPRWQRADIAAWIELRKNGPKRVGRPRRQLEI